jgi:preprotein translocase subunit Sss1
MKTKKMRNPTSEEYKIFHIGLGFGIVIGVIITLGIQFIYFL